MKFVATKTADQLDLQALHRVRERLVRQRTGIINQIRAYIDARPQSRQIDKPLATHGRTIHVGHELPRRLRQRHDRCASDSGRLAATPK